MDLLTRDRLLRLAGIELRDARPAEEPDEPEDSLLELLGVEEDEDDDDESGVDAALIRHRMLRLLGVEVRDQLRIPKGSVGGGRFRSKTTPIIALLKDWANGEGPDNPLEDLDRDALKRAAVQQGITVRPRAPKAEIIRQLLYKAKEDHKAGRGDKTPDAPKADVSESPDKLFTADQREQAEKILSRLSQGEFEQGIANPKRTRKELSDTARLLGLPSSGTKEVLQKRLAERAEQLRKGDVPASPAVAKVQAAKKATAGNGPKASPGSWKLPPTISSGEGATPQAKQVAELLQAGKIGPDEAAAMLAGKKSIPAVKKATPSKATPRKPADPSVREVEVDNLVRQAYRDAIAAGDEGPFGRPTNDRTPTNGDYVMLAGIRERIGDKATRQEVDEALARFAREGRVQPQEDQKRLKPKDRESALQWGGGEMHMISLDDPSLRPLPTPASKATPRVPKESPADVAAKHPDFDASGRRVNPLKARQALTAAKTPEQRREYLRSLGMTQTQANALAKDLGAQQTRISIDATIDNIVEYFDTGPDKRHKSFGYGDSPAEVAAKLQTATSREQARELLKGKTAAELREIAKAANVAVPSKATKERLTDDIVQVVVGRRLTSDAISGSGAKPKTSRRARPSYLDAENSLLLEEYADSIGAPIRQYVDPQRSQMVAHGEPIERQKPFSFQFSQIIDGLKSGKVNQAQAVADLREIPQRVAANVKWARENIARFGGLPYHHAVIRDADAADAALRLADALEGLKLPRRRRLPTLGALTTSEIPEFDESRFAVETGRTKISPKGGLVLHRGEIVPESFEHPRSGFALLQSDAPNQRPGLTEEENHALDLYVSSAVADPLNGALRAGVDPPTVDLTVIDERTPVDLREVRRLLDTVISESHLSRDTTLWRGTLMRPADLRKLTPGAVISEPGYMSTAADSSLARSIISWRKKNAPAYRKPVLFRILVERGTPAAVGHETAGEVLFGRNSRLQVLRSEFEEWSGNTVITVLMLEGSP